MIKGIVSLSFAAFIAVVLSGCGEQPKPAPKPVNTTSYKKDQSSWQQFKSEKAMNDLDKEMNK